MLERILIICTGNICRSPMAEGLLKHYFSLKQHTTIVSSAGLAAVVNHPATATAQSLLRDRHIDISDHRAQQINQAQVVAADLILVMEDAQKKHIERLFPYTHGKVFLLGHWSKFEVPDPYRGDISDYEHALALIETGLTDWQTKLCNL